MSRAPPSTKRGVGKGSGSSDDGSESDSGAPRVGRLTFAKGTLGGDDAGDEGGDTGAAASDIDDEITAAAAALAPDLSETPMDTAPEPRRPPTTPGSALATGGMASISFNEAAIANQLRAPATRAEDDADTEAELRTLSEFVSVTLANGCADAIDTLSQLSQFSDDRNLTAAGVLPSVPPTLGFVRAVTQVLALDKTVADAADALKNSLYVLLRARESQTANTGRDGDGGGGSAANGDANSGSSVAAHNAASDARAALVAVGGSPSFILADVSCVACAACRDVDVMRDFVRGEDGTPVWTCPCSAAYSSETLEASLVDALERASMSYQAQDLHCSRCSRTRASAVRRNCECSGDYTVGAPSAAFSVLIESFKIIADACGFEWLRDTAHWMSSM